MRTRNRNPTPTRPVFHDEVTVEFTPDEGVLQDAADSETWSWDGQAWVRVDEGAKR